MTKGDSFPTLTFKNILKYAWEHRRKYKLPTDDLGQVCEHMTQHTDWQPDIHIMRNGLRKIHYKLFRDKCNCKAKPASTWWTPRYRHKKKDK